METTESYQEEIVSETGGDSGGGLFSSSKSTSSPILSPGLFILVFQITERLRLHMFLNLEERPKRGVRLGGNGIFSRLIWRRIKLLQESLDRLLQRIHKFHDARYFT